MASDPIDALRRTAYPNPERIGCPAPEVFEALKRREIAFDDPVWQHIERCSPCYCEFANIRKEIFRQERKSNSANRFRLAAGLAVAIALGSGAYLWQHRSPTDQGSNTGRIGAQSGEAAVLNFEDGSELRGAGEPETQTLTPQHLRRNQLRLTVFLPLGSPSGKYELEMVSADQKIAWHETGTATIKDGLTSVSVSGDLRQLVAGKYAFRFRRPDETWREKSVLVQ